MSIRRHWLFIIAFFCAAVLVGGVYFWHSPRQYESVTSLRIVSPAPSRQGLEATGADMEAEAEYARGDLVLSTALASDRLKDLPMMRGQQNPIDFVRSKLRISSKGGSDELRLSLISSSPADARLILNSIASAFVLASNARGSQGTPLSVSILKPAETLAALAWPRPVPVLLIAGLGGLLVGCLLAWLRDAASMQPLDPIDASMSVRAPLLGCVPPLPRNLSSAALRGQSILVNPCAPFAGDWNQLMKALDSVFVANFDKTILFTAAGRARGKTLLASNMAIAMAKAGHRVVLVDGHPDRAAIGEIFGTDQTSGLADVIEGRASLDDVLRMTGLAELEVLPAGTASGTWRPLLNSQNFIDVLSELSERFDRVLIDGGPAASDECRILGACCDIAVLLADGRVGSRRELRTAANGLRYVGARLAGVVWNRSPRQIAALSSLASRKKIKESETTASTNSGRIRAESAERTSEERIESALVSQL